MVEVVAGACGAENSGRGAASGATGVADWKSSKSSSSVAVVEEFIAGVEAPGSSNEKRSTSGSFFFGGSGFLAVVLSVPVRLLLDVDDETSACRLPEAGAAPSSYSSYSSNLSPRLLPPAPESWKSLDCPPNPPPSPN